MKFDIVSFGSALIDIFVYTGIPDDGKVMTYPIGEKIQIKQLDFDIGGGGINTSTTFSRFGLKTGFIGNIGEDKLGVLISEKIKTEKIKFLGEKKGRTGYSIVLDSKKHDRTILTFKGGNDYLQTKKIDSKWVYFSALQKKSFREQLKIAKSGKYRIAYNPSLYLFGNSDVKELVRYCEILILNKEEADRLGKHSEINKIGPKIVVVTDGKNDFFCYTDKKKYKVFPHKKVGPVEKTGAGDAFASGFVASYIKGADLKKSLQIGVANSESVIRYKGSTNKILTWKQALLEIKKNPCVVEEL